MSDFALKYHMLKLCNCCVNLLHSVLSSQHTEVLDSLQNTFALHSARLKKAWLFHSPLLTRDTVLSQWKWESVLHCASPRKDQRICKEPGLLSALFNWWAHVSVSWTMFTTIEQRDTHAAHARHMWGMKLGCDKRTGHSSFKKTPWALILHNELGQAYLSHI